MGDLVNLLLALGARVLHVFDPLFDAWEAVRVGARVQLGLATYLDLLQADTASLKLLFWCELLVRFPIAFHRLSQLVARALQADTLRFCDLLFVLDIHLGHSADIYLLFILSMLVFK